SFGLGIRDHRVAPPGRRIAYYDRGDRGRRQRATPSPLPGEGYPPGAFLLFSLFSRFGGGRWEKRAGVMRGLGEGPSRAMRGLPPGIPALALPYLRPSCDKRVTTLSTVSRPVSRSHPFVPLLNRST